MQYLALAGHVSRRVAVRLLHGVIEPTPSLYEPHFQHLIALDAAIRVKRMPTVAILVVFDIFWGQEKRFVALKRELKR